MNILLIEPDNVLRRTYKAYLTAAGMTVAACGDAQTAIMLADEQAPDVVILELQLRQHSGIEFLYEYRSYPEWQQTPIVINTSIPKTDVHIPSDVKIARYMYKPNTSLRQLKDVLNTLIPSTV